MPTPSDVINWCEKRERPICEAVDREARIERQFRETDAWMNQTVPESLKAKGRAWLDRTDTVAAQLSGDRPGGYTHEQKEELLKDAANVGAEIAGMKLHPETLRTLAQPEE